MRRNRLVKRARKFKWYGPVHEYLAVDGSIINSDIFSPRDIYYYANELYDNGFYEKAIKSYTNFLNIKDGWIEDKISACYKLADSYSRLGNSEKELEYI